VYRCTRIVNDESTALKFSGLLDPLENNCNIMNPRPYLVHMSKGFLKVASLETSDALVESRLPRHDRGVVERLVSSNLGVLGLA